MFGHAKASMTRQVARGATAVTGGLLLLGVTTGMAGANALPGGDTQNLQHVGPDDGPSSSLVNLSENQIPVQICHNQVPVNGVGAQVPIQDLTAALGLGVLGGGAAPVSEDSSCHQPSAQQP